MVGVAAGVAMTTQEDLSVAGHDREAMMAFYAAEYAVAQGKSFLSTANNAWDFITPGNGWSPFLQQLGLVQQCLAVGGSQPGTVPKPTNPPQLYFNTPSGGQVTWQFCIHNNFDDPAYKTGSGDSSDASDVVHFLVVEGYGFAPNGAKASITATVGPPPTANNQMGSCYAQEGGCGTHTGNTGLPETGIPINTAQQKSWQ